MCSLSTPWRLNFVSLGSYKEPLRLRSPLFISVTSSCVSLYWEQKNEGRAKLTSNFNESSKQWWCSLLCAAYCLAPSGRSSSDWLVFILEFMATSPAAAAVAAAASATGNYLRVFIVEQSTLINQSLCLSCHRPLRSSSGCSRRLSAASTAAATLSSGLVWMPSVTTNIQ